MDRRHVTADSHDYLIADDDPSPVAMRTWALVATRAIDEITLQPPHGEVEVDIDTTAGLTPRTVDGGVIGLVGRPWCVAAPLLADTRPIEFTVRVRGYLPSPIATEIATQRRVLTAAAPADVLSLSSTAHLSAGLGVLVERETPAGVDEWTAIAALGPAADQVTLRAPLRVARSAGRAVTPDLFVPTRMPDVRLHRARHARIRGRAVESPALTAPHGAPAARVAVTGVWWDRPSVTTQPARPPRLIVVDPPLYAARAAGVGTIESCALAPSGPVRFLDRRVAAAADSLVVSSRSGLALGGGDLLRLENPSAAEAEWILTESVDGSSDPSLPAAVRLRARTAYAHDAGAPVQPMTVAATTPVGAFERDGVPGDETVFLDTLAGLSSFAMIRVSGAAPPHEFHRIRLLPSTDLVTFFDQPAIDADGYFELPPIGRIAQLTLLARLAGYPDVSVDVAPDYAHGNDLTIVFRT